MDVTSRVEIEFLDLSDLDASSRNEISAILRSDTATEILKLPWDSGEIEYGNLEEVDMHEPQKISQNCSMEGAIKYDNVTNSSSSVLFPLQYGYAIYDNGYMYNVDPNCSYIQSVQLMTPNMYSNCDPHEMALMRDNSRRGRSRSHVKRDNYNRSMNHTNEMQVAYVNDHVPMSYPPVYSNLTVAATGSPIYFNHSQPMQHYHSSTLQQPNHNIHSNFPPFQSASNLKYSRQSQGGFSQINGDPVQNTSSFKGHEKRTQNVNTSKPSNRQPVDENKIVTTVIVNNSEMDPSVHNNNENLAVVDANIRETASPVNVQTEHNCQTHKVTDEKTISCMNSNSHTEMQQSGEENKSGKNKTKSQGKSPIQTPTLKVEDIQEEREVKPEVECPSVETLAQTATAMSWAKLVSNGPCNANVHSPANKCSTNVTRVTPQVSDEQNETAHADRSNAQNATKNNQSENGKNVETPRNSLLSTQNEISLHIDDPKLYQMGEYFLTYEMDKQTVSLVPRGLTNRSNYCYINSILQALLACPPFFNLLKALPYSPNPSKNSQSPLINNMIKFAHEFTPLADGGRLARANRVQKRNEDSVVDIQPGMPFEPSYVYTMLKNTSSAGVFSVEGRQEDAEEFLSCLLNGISDEMLELMKLANNNEHKSINIDANSNLSGGEEEWKVMGSKNKSSITRSVDFGRTPLSDIFQGKLRSRVSRASDQTNPTTDYIQPFFTLQLDIEKAESVNDALEILVGKDQVEGMTCSKTNQQVKAWKQVTLEVLPVILILHLKWFDYKLDGCSKILKEIKFPIDLKIDTKFLSPGKTKCSPKSKQYKLFAVTYHDGKEATKGHYITDAFHVGYGGWVRYDDSSLKGVSEGNVLNPQPPRVPYLLYYRRCDTIGNNNNPPNNTKSR